MSFRIVLRGSEPSGRFLAVLCARTGETIDTIRKRLNSTGGMILKENLSRDEAELLVTELPDDESVSVSIRRGVDSWVAVLVGYRPGSRGRLRSALQRLSKLSTEEVIHFLANIPIALKSGIDRKTAIAVKELLEREGGIVEVRPFTGSQAADLSSKTVPVERIPVQKEETPAVEAEVSPELPGSTPEIPPKVSALKAAALPVESEIPARIYFRPPEQISVSAPQMILPEEDAPEVFTPPHVFRFTVPGKPVPPAVEEASDYSVPGITDEACAIPLFLHPVGSGQKKRTCSILNEFSGLSDDKCLEIMDRAPVVLSLFRERINALVALRELSERGVPVSLVESPDGVEERNGRTSFFGWLNGTV